MTRRIHVRLRTNNANNRVVYRPKRLPTSLIIALKIFSHVAAQMLKLNVYVKTILIRC